MKTKQILTPILALVLILSILALSINVGSFTTSGSPKVKASAPTSMQFAEDFAPYYLDLYDIFDEPSGSLTFALWTGSSWGNTFSGDAITVTIQANDTLRFTSIQDMHGTDKVSIEATNSNQSSTVHNITVTVTPVNDPPVIETIGNMNVRNSDKVDIFSYQNDWYNETVTASDADGDRVIFLDNTTLFDINYLTGNISFKPDNNDVGTVYINITVSDINGTNCEDWLHIKFTILNVNDPPTAIITYPENGSIIFNEKYMVFEGAALDPDELFGEKHFFKWTSDIDGALGEGQEIEVYFLTVGTHQITLNVTDSGGLHDTDSITIIVKRSPYEPYYNIELSMDENSVIVKANETGICEMTVSNFGFDEDNVTFDIVQYFDFPGKVELEDNYVILEPEESAECNVTISVPENTEVGLYLIEINSVSSLREQIEGGDGNKEEPYRYDYYGYEDTETISVIVISNNTKNIDKQANKPVWEIGYNWVYSMEVSESQEGFGSLEGTITMMVTDETTEEIEDTNYDVYILDIGSDLELDGDSFYGATDVEMNISGKDYFQTSNLALVQEEMQAEYSIRLYGEVMNQEIDMTTTYKPPLNAYDFPIKPNDTWTTETTATERTKYSYTGSGPYGDSYMDTSVTKETSSYICLGIENVTTLAGTFETFIILEFDKDIEYRYEDWEEGYGEKSSSSGSRMFNFGNSDANGYSIEYYSPEVRSTVREVHYEEVYDYDYEGWEERYYWEETMVVELSSYSFNKNGTKPDPNVKPDSDNDNIPDAWEKEFGLDPTKDDSAEDDDNDGFTNLEEAENGTDPTNSRDTPKDPIDDDDDGLPDTWERFYDLDPDDPGDAKDDSDNDGFNNIDEYDSNTDPTNPYDHPPKSDDDDSSDPGAFGLGKIGGFDLAYIYIILLLIIITILTLFSLAYRKRRVRRTRQQKPGPAEARVAGSAEQSAAITETPTPIAQPRVAAGTTQGSAPAPTATPKVDQRMQQDKPGVDGYHPPQATQAPTSQPEYNPQPTPKPYYPPPPPPPPTFEYNRNRQPESASYPDYNRDQDYYRYYHKRSR